MKLIDYTAEQLVREIYGGSVDVNNLPVDLYKQIANKLKSGLFEGFGGTPKDFNPFQPDGKLLAELQNNIYIFSAAKTYQQVRVMSAEVGPAKNFKEFKEKATTIFDTFNQTWLKTEYDTSIGMAQNARKWNEFEADKDVFPLLKYDAVLDRNTSEICKPLDGIVLPVGHPFWSTHAPLNHFNCRCMLVQVSKHEGTKETESEKVNKAAKETGKLMKPLFKMNPGTDKVVFKEKGPGKHPYFEVAAKDKKLAERNFNLPIPETGPGKQAAPAKKEVH